MRLIEVRYSTGDTIRTRINGTDEEIRAYYVGRWFNLGGSNPDTEEDRMARAVSVEFLN